MNDLARWHDANARHLAAALAWLRLRLARPGASLTRDRPDDPAAGAELDRAADTLAAAEAGEPPPALALLAGRLGLSRFEQETLLLCAAPELDPRFGALCARAQDDPARPHPTFALALSLFDE